MTCPMREIGSGAEHCPYDWLAVYDGHDDHAPLIGKFCGVGKFPFSIIGKIKHTFVLLFIIYFEFLVHQRTFRLHLVCNKISFNSLSFPASSSISIFNFFVCSFCVHFGDTFCFFFLSLSYCMQ